MQRAILAAAFACAAVAAVAGTSFNGTRSNGIAFDGVFPKGMRPVLAPSAEGREAGVFVFHGVTLPGGAAIALE
jgi:hypothetical protein